MSRFAIIVSIKLKPGTAEEFKPHILANAEAAVRDEPDCHLFHVVQTQDDPDRFFFYEVYTDEAALETHRQQPHYKRFIDSAGDLVEERVIHRVKVLNPDNIA